ncbi:MAG: alpha/beta hydrolase [Spirochaetales bacterium]|nr:alpha/beta hydrolase [Spirochaetales bacterium]
MILIYIAAFILIATGAAGYILSRISLNPKTHDYEESYRSEVEAGQFDDKWFRSLESEDVYIQSRDGLKLHGLWYPAEGSQKTIILSHGYSYTLYGSVKYMKMFHDRGFNLLLIDHRYHGLSEGKICTMGHREKMDHVSWVNWIEHRVGRDTLIGTHGESMGATTALLHGEIDDRVGFIIADCAFQSLFDQFRYRLKAEFKMPAFPLLYAGNFFSKIRAGLFYGEVSALNAVKKIKAPVLFIHGHADDYTTPSNSVNLKKAKSGSAFLYLVPGAGHAESFKTDPENYRKVVYRFLDNAGV